MASLTAGAVLRPPSSAKVRRRQRHEEPVQKHAGPEVATSEISFVRWGGPSFSPRTKGMRNLTEGKLSIR